MAAEQTVYWVMALAGVVAFQLLQRQAGDPDFIRKLHMKSAKRAEKVYARLAAWSWRRAEQARREYEAGRS
jgi:hypothetical protein